MKSISLKSLGLKSVDVNTLLFIILLLVVVLLICFKAISMQSNLKEFFQNNENNNSNNASADNADGDLTQMVGLARDVMMDNNDNSNNNDSSMMDNLSQMAEDLGAVYNKSDDTSELDNLSRDELAQKCKSLTDTEWGSITSKYSGKTINIEAQPPINKVRKYLIKWQPLGGKPGGCLTANADGTYSTPICNQNINKQLWFIKEIKNEEQYRKLIPKDRQTMGKDLEETHYPFHIVQSSEFDNLVLHYEGGGLAVREIANYDAQKWDVSSDKIQQDPLPTQGTNKHSGLTPGHRRTEGDSELSGMGNGKSSSNNDSGASQLNINLDADLLRRLGLLNGTNQMGGSNSNMGGVAAGNNGEIAGADVDGEGGLLISNEEQAVRRRRGRNNSDMVSNVSEDCENCGDIPERFIRKDLVKSMCVGCNNIDNVVSA